ncbi:copper homeostasis protein [Paenibacillus anaericanus]|uniref:copper homeostasis protein CutC n=1 Tax=Paenibacillus anaericanus TaxID=170367 RepID=UPI00278125B3|nr:copper homeostasis protein CutC [Paenibacillus anaericanus]MDQ0089721.1 copper homeostasis protein [Paenibacillus anaericanus]
MVVLEVIATCVEDALLAEECSAGRLELITAITEGGLTPSIGMIEQVVAAVDIPVNVMVRPHSRSFVYGKQDVATMSADIKAIAATGAAGIVIGALTVDRDIDEAFLEQVLPLAGKLDVTFHRAFDDLEDMVAGLRTLLRYPQISRVLTSGGVRPAPEAVPMIRKLVEITRDREAGSLSQPSSGHSLRILAGHGLTIEGIESFIEATGVSEVHFGSAVRLDSSALAPIDPTRLKDLVNKISNIG